MKTIIIVLITIFSVACTNTFIPCPVPCGPGVKCINGRCVKDEYVNNPYPRPGPPQLRPYFECYDDNQCRRNQECENGRCIRISKEERCRPRCQVNQKCIKRQCMRTCSYTSKCWPNQLCQNGVCIKISHSQCNPQCSYGTVCRHRRCVPYDQCLHISCPDGYYCQNGQCFPEYNPCTKCLPTQSCSNGICVDKCHLIRCGYGTFCKDGYCVPHQKACRFDNQCQQNDACRYGFCKNACTSVTCLMGSTCIHGNCIKSCRWPRDCPNGQICQYSLCINKCRTVSCPPNYLCVNGVCQPYQDQCGYHNICPQGSLCKNGKCIPNIETCPIYQPYTATSCSLPRPNQQTCPQLFYIRQPDPAFCGVRYDGVRVNFVRECQPCKDTRVSYYFNQPCHDAPFVCEGGQYCKDYYCSGVCRNNEQCPYDWQLCSNGRCADRCEVLKCASCKFGQCGYQPASGSCSPPLFQNIGCSNPYWSCIGFKCVDLCLKKSCPPYHDCRFGQCFPNGNGY